MLTTAIPDNGLYRTSYAVYDRLSQQQLSFLFKLPYTTALVTDISDILQKLIHGSETKYTKLITKRILTRPIGRPTAKCE